MAKIGSHSRKEFKPGRLECTSRLQLHVNLILTWTPSCLKLLVIVLWLSMDISTYDYRRNGTVAIKVHAWNWCTSAAKIQIQAIVSGETLTGFGGTKQNIIAKYMYCKKMRKKRKKGGER
ncbi:hypothetical protein Lal_00027592 [Lupinus albus]|nr:hypothetical protein Lal_00027592 [Lupinus albus]